MDWQVQCEVAVNVDDCEDGQEAIARVKLCLVAARLPSIKKMRVLSVDKPKAIERSRQKEATNENGARRDGPAEKKSA